LFRRLWQSVQYLFYGLRLAPLDSLEVEPWHWRELPGTNQMTPERYQQIGRLLDAAMERAPGERAAFLAEACYEDEALRREVESLLEAHEQAGSFIEVSAAEASTSNHEQTVIGRMLGHYQMVALLGTGGMGEVYRARDTRLERDVAVKILPEHLAQDSEALRRFEREAKAVAALAHPNVCAIYDFGREQGTTYAVMELLEGETLRDHLSRSALDWREAVGVALEVAEGLAAAHQKQIVHRDLKPENIFLTRNGQAKVLDFGIARVKHPVSPESATFASTITERTEPGRVIGTVTYMSPEQVRGEAVDAPSDIFSLGCVLYEMVSGQRAFARATTAETIAAILNEEPPMLAGAGKKMPSGLGRVIRHCLLKQPGGRYQSASELAIDLRALKTSSKNRLIARPIETADLRPPLWLWAAVIILLLGIAAGWYLISGHRSAIDSLAVLPLINASGSADTEYLSDGITESLINNLSQLPRLRVMSRSTAFSYKGREADPRKVGQELNVQAVLTGRIRQQGDSLVIWAELVNTRDGSRLWGEQYNRKQADVLGMEIEIARQISEKLRLSLTGEEHRRLTKRHTDNPEAFKTYLMGRYHLGKYTEEGCRKALEYMKQAIDLDPNYALAYVGMADTYYTFSNQYLPPDQAMPKSRAAAMKALEIDETLAEAHAALAVVKSNYEWDWVTAERGYRRALELNPGYAPAHQMYGIYLTAMGRPDEALKELREARELDPLSPSIAVCAGWPYYFAPSAFRQYDRAIEDLRKILALDPDFFPARAQLAAVYVKEGMYEKAITELTRANELSKNDRVILGLLAYTYAAAGKKSESRRMLSGVLDRAKLEQASPNSIAAIYAGLGEKDQAFAWLEKAYQAHDEYMTLLKVDPVFDTLRSDPRYTDLLRRMNLSQ
jgi:eukaryotic-like serine/threonine-protein kinase